MDVAKELGHFPLGARVRHQYQGLGTVIATPGRNIQVHFDEGSTAIFNPRATPIERAIWRAGDKVHLRDLDTSGTVVGCESDAGVIVYTVQAGTGGLTLAIREAGLTDSLEADFPEEHLRRGQFDTSKHFYFRTIGHYLACAAQRLGTTSIAARIVPMPHQLFVAHRVINAPRQRFLLADEVGLGKTIETGLILQELRARGALERVLIVVPPNLDVQWLFEMRSKFNEQFRLYNSQTIKQIKNEQPGQNIWETGRNIICTKSYLTSNPEEWDDILSVPWDLVVFDEAHHIRRQLDRSGRQSATVLYRFASQLSQRTRGLLFLTATPMQLDPFELYSMVELLDPTLFYSYESFRQQLEHNQQLNTLIRKLVEIEDLGLEERLSLSAEVGTFIDDATLLSDPRAHFLTSQVARDAIVERLVEQHLLSAVMIRNRKRLVGQFTRRIPRIIAVELSELELELYQATNAYIRHAYQDIEASKRAFAGFMLTGYQKRLTSSLHAFRESLRRRIDKISQSGTVGLVTPEDEPIATDEVSDIDIDEFTRSLEGTQFTNDTGRHMAELAALNDLMTLAGTVTQDAKYIAFEQQVAEILDVDPNERILVFSEFVDTLEFLEYELSKRWSVATFHGRMRDDNKDESITRFRDGSAQILLSSEAGGEGRNLQYCAILVNYDLPWNPMRVEQRIGRLDRIGQTRDVQIFNFALLGTIEERVLDVLSRRINVFEETVGGLDPILGEMELEIQKILLESNVDEADRRLHAYADGLEAQVRQARLADEKKSDFVLEQRSYDAQRQLSFDINERNQIERHQNKFSKALLKYIGAEIRQIGSDTFRIHLGRRVTVELPGVPKSVYQITFNYQRALDDSVVEYGSFGHPLFDTLVELATSESFSEGRTASRTIEHDEYAGFRGFQFNFMVTLRSVQESKQLVPVAVGVDGRHYPELTNVLLDSFDWQHPQNDSEPSFSGDWTAAVDTALETAETIVERQLHREVEVLRNRAETDYENERHRIERFIEYREAEGERKLVHDEEITQRLRASIRDEDQRILPIWERNVTNAREHLVALKRERERMLSELEERRHVTYTYELINAAWVTIMPSSGQVVDDDSE